MTPVLARRVLATVQMRCTASWIAHNIYLPVCCDCPRPAMWCWPWQLCRCEAHNAQALTHCSHTHTETAQTQTQTRGTSLLACMMLSVVATTGPGGHYLEKPQQHPAVPAAVYDNCINTVWPLRRPICSTVRSQTSFMTSTRMRIKKLMAHEPCWFPTGCSGKA